MISLDEAQAASLLSGLRVLSEDQTIPFTQYTRYVLPLDGYVFWLETQRTAVQGSLHYAVDKQQREDETIAVNRVVFTTGDEVQPFNAVGPDTIWVGTVGSLRFAFSQQANFYRASGLYHYSGFAVYPALESQLVDIGAQPSNATLIVSNSLPAWLALKSYAPIWLVAGNPGITLYPSFLVPDNLRPPYGTVHISPEATQPIPLQPFIDQRGNHYQLACDQVRVTLYGTTNQEAQAFLDLVYQYSSDTDNIGIMSPAIVRDEKRTQAEMTMLAMKKTLDFGVSYLQEAMPNVARQLILSAPITYILQ